MARLNTNNRIYLVDFYNSDIYSLDINNMKLVKVEQKVSSDSLGYIAFESCGLFRKKQKIFAIFCYKTKPCLLIDNIIVDILGEGVQVKFNDFFPLVQELVVSWENMKFCCKRWSKDIDEFVMDDFLFFLRYSYKQKFQNICIENRDMSR